ncbi:MAG: nucleotide sugar dehydrogenase [Desulfobacterales bacterium]|nr:nucleotide sugar dehydrogenase [Desulfobacterales bacterium]
MNYKKELLDKLNNQQAVIGVIGMGYVGLPLILLFSSKGYKVYGFDIDQSKVDSLIQGRSYIEHIDASPLKIGYEKKSFLPTSDFSLVKNVDTIILCVPTPLNDHREPDLSFIVNSVEAILPYIQKGQSIALESTTYPGTTEEVLRPQIEKMGFTIGEDFFLIYSPEREDPANQKFTTQTIPKVCGGSTSNCLEIGKALYGNVIDKVVPVSSTQAAEMVKILENTFRSVNIALVNEMKIVAEKMKIDIFEVIDAASTKPFGFMSFYPGPGLGGHCIPIDPFYLTWKAREFGLSTRFIELAGEVNVSMPDYVINKVAEGLNRHKKSINGSKILILGLAYKKNVDDVRESPSVVLMEKLNEKGAIISYSDPHVLAFPKMRKHFLDLQSIEITPESLAQFDCILISTNHDKFDWKMIKDHSKLIVDSRGVYKTIDNEKIIRA